MKQGKTEKAVFAKLSTQKVELAKSVGELQKVIRNAEIYRDSVNDASRDLANMINRIKGLSQEIERKESFMKEAFDKSQDYASELVVFSQELDKMGISDDSVKEVREARTVIKDLQKRVNTLSDIVKESKRYIK
jgi:Glu-tRNA(Gln) amidotransferase subunit E-like FAD-binding protein